MHAHFDPIKGENSPGTREMVEISDMYPYKMLLPVSMLSNKLVKRIIRYKSIRAFCKVTFKRYDEELHEKVVRQFIKVRNKHDFPFWAYSFCEIGGRQEHPFQAQLSTTPAAIRDGEYEIGGTTHKDHPAKGPAMGRFHVGTAIYSVDTTMP